MTYRDHRSIRAYTSQPIADELLSKILQTGTRASNTGNFQSYSIIVTRQREQKEKLAPLHFNQPMVLQAPVLLTFCVDYNRILAWCEANQADCGHLNLMGFTNATLDTMLLAQNVAVAAEENGLGLCFLGTVLYNLEPLIQLLELPKGVIPILAMSLGYPDEEPPMRVRLPLEAVVHYEKYTPTTPDSVKRLYADLENDPYYIAQVAKAEVPNLAKLVMEKQYPRSNYEMLSTSILNILEQQGFQIKH